jgi:ABC-type sugar transport system ATPase subunit
MDRACGERHGAKHTVSTALSRPEAPSTRQPRTEKQKQIGVTTVFVTHDQIEAMTMGDVIVVMNKGRIE